MIFRIIPPWLKEEAEATCRETLERGESDLSMPQRISEALKAFAALGVTRERIETRLGYGADAMTPVDLANLRVTFNSIKRGETALAEEFPLPAADDAAPKGARLDVMEAAFVGSTPPAADPPAA